MELSQLQSDWMRQCESTGSTDYDVNRTQGEQNTSICDSSRRLVKPRRQDDCCCQSGRCDIRPREFSRITQTQLFWQTIIGTNLRQGRRVRCSRACNLSKQELCAAGDGRIGHYSARCMHRAPGGRTRCGVRGKANETLLRNVR